ncbi:SEL1-like repeat protein [Hydrogenimonas cancrithermarum]|nr:SEL1-like repeat protein [Hydrogenimonas cancrithermarum]
MGNARSCHNLASMFYHGTYVRKDLEAAKFLFEKACEFGDAGSCEAYERMLEK